MRVEIRVPTRLHFALCDLCPASTFACGGVGLGIEEPFLNVLCNSGQGDIRLKGLGIEISSSDSAQKLLAENGQDVVAKQIIDLQSNGQSPLIIISGLRIVEELDLIYQSFKNVQTLLISADKRIRFERHVRRGRDTSVKTVEQFSQLDEEQLSFGLLQVADEVSNISLINEGSLSSYYKRVDSAFHEALVVSRRSSGRKFDSLSEMHRSLVALNKISRIASCEEISKETAKLGGQVWRYNTNRALKGIPLFVDRYDKGEELLSYEINKRGVRLLRLLNTAKGFVG